MASEIAVQSRDGEFAGTVDRAAEQVASNDGIVPSSKVDVEMEIWFTVLFGNIAHKAGYFHLLVEGPVDIFLGRGVEESQRGAVDGSYPVDLSGQDPLVLAECGQCRNQLLVIVYAYDEPVAVID